MLTINTQKTSSSHRDGSPYPCHCRRRDISHEQLVWIFYASQLRQVVQF